MPLFTSLCFYCHLRLDPRNASLAQLGSWQPTRLLTHVQKRRPPRMSLSPRVTQSTPKDKHAKRETSPFGGMNQRVPPRIATSSRRSQSQPIRSPRSGKFSGTKEKANQGNKDTFHALKMQKALVDISYGLRNRVKSKISEITSFEELSLLQIIKESIPTQSFIGTSEPVPTPIQRLAIPQLLNGNTSYKSKSRCPDRECKQFLIAAETGSGKTLAYVLPLLDTIKRADILQKEENIKGFPGQGENGTWTPHYVEPPPKNSTTTIDSTSGRPRAIILVPTAELVNQVTKLLKSFCHTVKLKASGISASSTPHVIRNRLFSTKGIDILIATPHLLSSILISDPNVLSRVTNIVIDEADSLMDRSFSPITTNIIERAAPSLKQLTMCSATIPKSLDSFLRSRYPDMRRLVTPNLHAIPRRVQLGVVDVARDPYRGNKDLACADTIYTIGKLGTDISLSRPLEHFTTSCILVFVNERERSEDLSCYLRSKGIDAVALHRDTGERRCDDILLQFTKNSAAQKNQQEGLLLDSGDQQLPLVGTRNSLQNTKVLVTTDLGSRGIDTTAVRHVILYDVPHSTIDFIHRLGRTGRMGRRGRGVVLVGKGDRRDVVKEVRESMFRGQALI